MPCCPGDSAGAGADGVQAGAWEQRVWAAVARGDHFQLGPGQMAGGATAAYRQLGVLAGHRGSQQEGQRAIRFQVGVCCCSVSRPSSHLKFPIVKNIIVEHCYYRLWCFSTGFSGAGQGLQIEKHTLEGSWDRKEIVLIFNCITTLQA